MSANERSRQAAIEKLERSFIDAVDPDRTLPEVERFTRAYRVRAEHFRRMGRRSALMRTERRLRALLAAQGAEGTAAGAAR